MLRTTLTKIVSSWVRGSSDRRYLCTNSTSSAVISPTIDVVKPTTMVEKLKYLVSKASENRVVSTTLNRDVLVHSRSHNVWNEVYHMKAQNPKEIVIEIERLYEGTGEISPSVLPAMLSAYGKTNNVNRLVDILVTEVDRNQLQLQWRHLTQLISSLGRSQNISCAMALYDLLAPKYQSSIVLNSIVDALSHNHRPDLAKRVSHEWLLKHPRIHDINMYTTLAEAALKHHQFDWFQSIELDCRNNYHSALSSNRVALVSSSQYSPKHCVHVSSLLRRNWLPTLDIPKSSHSYRTVSISLAQWNHIRPSLPGNPLKKEEIDRWESDVDQWLVVLREHLQHTPTHESYVEPLDRNLNLR